jgi:hypothetical protein
MYQQLAVVKLGKGPSSTRSLYHLNRSQTPLIHSAATFVSTAALSTSSVFLEHFLGIWSLFH